MDSWVTTFSKSMVGWPQVMTWKPSERSAYTHHSSIYVDRLRGAEPAKAASFKATFKPSTSEVCSYVHHSAMMFSQTIRKYKAVDILVAITPCEYSGSK